MSTHASAGAAKIPQVARAALSLGLDSEAQDTIEQAPDATRRVLVMGAEGAGLRRLTRETCDALVRIGGAGGLGSLNVSNATAVGLYALTRETDRP